MVKSNIYTYIGIFFIFLAGLWGAYRIGEDDYFTGIFSFMFIIGMILYLWFRDRQQKKISFPDIKRDYISSMQEEEKISINPFAQVHRVTEEGNKYIFILKDFDNGIPTYYLCEADVYDRFNFGAGFGQYTRALTEAEYWFRTRRRFSVEQLMAEEIQKQTLREVLLRSKQQMALKQQLDTQQERSEFS